MMRTGRRVARGTITLVVSAALLWTTCDAALANDWSLTYKKFSASSKLSLVGSAKISKKLLELTDASGDAEAGAAWAEPSVDPAESFSTDFTANLSGANGCSADGLSFTIQSQGPDAIGRFGEGIGYEGISPALSVEFDDFQNAWDPDNNHVAIALNGDEKNPIATPQTLPVSLYGGGPFHVHITYQAPFDSGVQHPTIKVWAWRDGDMPADPTTQATLADAAPLGTVLQGNPAYVGFTAATAACNEKADVTNWTFGPLSPNQQISDAAININWTSPLSPIEGIQQSVSVNKTAPSIYFAMTWLWPGSDHGGYMGLQRDGLLFDGTTTKIALFSVWNAIDSQGTSCDKFTNEGEGLSCRVPYNFKAGHTYVYAVSRVSSSRPGVWWAASIQDISAKKPTVIGTLRAPDNSGAESIDPRLNNFSEYFGDTRLCDKVPTSDVTFRQPVVSGVTADALANFDASSPTHGACTGASITQQGSDVRVQLGGMR
jgi:hypothetical protein